MISVALAMKPWYWKTNHGFLTMATMMLQQRLDFSAFSASHPEKSAGRPLSGSHSLLPMDPMDPMGIQWMERMEIWGLQVPTVHHVPTVVHGQKKIHIDCFTTHLESGLDSNPNIPQL